MIEYWGLGQMPEAMEFNPKIIGYLCNWCCYGGADLCGVSRFQYPPYIRVVRIMCSGRVDMSFVFKAFSSGADGVFIGGCHINDCHYNTEGNYDALGMVFMCKAILAEIGINPERLRLEWVSAGEGIRFAEIMNEYGAQVKRLGPLGSAGDEAEPKSISAGLDAAARLVPFIRLAERERMRPPARSEDGYRRFFSSPDFKGLFDELVLDKLSLARVIGLLREKPLSASEISSALGLAVPEVSRLLNRSSKMGLVRYDTGLKRYALA